MATTLLLQIDQTDNGLNALIADVSDFTSTTNTGVTAVTITLTYNGVSYVVINESKAQPCAQSSLSWSIPSTAIGMASGTSFPDGIYTVNVSYIVSPSISPLTSLIYFDWNAKFYDYSMVKNLPYKLDNNQFAFNSDVEKSIVFNTLLKGAQYNSAVGQTTKAKDIMAIIERFKLIN